MKTQANTDESEQKESIKKPEFDEDRIMLVYLRIVVDERRTLIEKLRNV